MFLPPMRDTCCGCVLLVLGNNGRSAATTLGFVWTKPYARNIAYAPQLTDKNNYTHRAILNVGTPRLHHVVHDRLEACLRLSLTASK
jgi:hypothetical protein